MTGRVPADDGERGSATVWMVALAGLLALVGVATVLVGAAVVARHRATSAADLVALAAAGRAVLGDPAACAVAEEVAAANEAVVDSCAVTSGAVVEVRVHVPVRLGPLGVVDAPARARAGPAPPDTEPAPEQSDGGGADSSDAHPGLRVRVRRETARRLGRLAERPSPIRDRRGARVDPTLRRSACLCRRTRD